MICPCCGKHKKPPGLDGMGTALKPAMELVCVARKPLEAGTVASNVLKWGVGGLNIDATRVPANGDKLGGGDQRSSTKQKVDGWDRPWMQNEEMKAAHASRVNANVAKSEALGRWPANLVHDGSPEVLACFPETSASPPVGSMGGGSNKHSIFGEFAGQRHSNGHGDSGSAARFFNQLEFGAADRLFYSAKADASDRLNSRHPTVKPLSLMQHLVRLVTPKGGTVLDCFAGTGTTGHAALLEGCCAILCEREPEYCADIERRMSLVYAGPDERVGKLVKQDNHDTMPLFGAAE